MGLSTRHLVAMLAVSSLVHGMVLMSWAPGNRQDVPRTPQVKLKLSAVTLHDPKRTAPKEKKVVERKRTVAPVKRTW